MVATVTCASILLFVKQPSCCAPGRITTWGTPSLQVTGDSVDTKSATVSEAPLPFGLGTAVSVSGTQRLSRGKLSRRGSNTRCGVGGVGNVLGAATLPSALVH